MAHIYSTLFTNQKSNKQQIYSMMPGAGCRYADTALLTAAPGSWSYWRIFVTSHFSYLLASFLVYHIEIGIGVSYYMIPVWLYTT